MRREWTGPFVQGIGFVLAGLLLLALSACGGSSSGGGPGNTAPSLTVPAPQNVVQGEAVSGVSCSATDPDTGDTLTFSLASAGAPAGMAIDPATGAVSWTPTYDQIGTHNVTVSVTDGQATTSDTLTFVVAPAAADGAAPLAGGTLDPLSIPRYVTPLVIPPVMNNDGATDSYDIAVRQFKQQILPGGIWNTITGRNDNFPATTVWSYGPASDPEPDSSALGGGAGIAPAGNSQFNYPAYTIETLADTPVSVRWINDLVDDNGNYLSHLLTVDQTLHWANPMMTCLDGSTRTDCMGTSGDAYTGPVPIVTHVHGAHVEGHSDGYPEAWWLPAANNLPAGIATSGTLFDDSTGSNPGTLGYADYVYRNDQPATTLWYHDHSLGMTRLNVYAGPAGFWLIRGDHTGAAGTVVDAIDNQDPAVANDGVLPGPAPVAGQTVLDLNTPGNAVRNAIREIPVVIQGRAFNNDGSLFYPSRRAFFEGLDPAGLIIDFAGDPDNPTDIAPLWNPEAFFNVMVVNGVSWPKLDVAQAMYRFRLLNGCNSRFLNLAAFRVDPTTGYVDLTKELPFYQIGTEQGFLPNVVKVSTGFATTLSGDGTVPADTPAEPGQAVLLAPAERADMLIDFAGTYVDGTPIADGDIIRIINTAGDEPFGGIDPLSVSDATTSGQVMQFIVKASLTGASPTDPGGATPATAVADIVLNPEPANADPVAAMRTLSLNEESSHDVCVVTGIDGVILQLDPSIVPPYDPSDPLDSPLAFEARCLAAGGEPFAPKAALLGEVDFTDPANPAGVGLRWTDSSSPNNIAASVTMADGVTLKTVNVVVNPTVGNTEEWQIYNFTEDAHPIHLHLVRFEVVSRTAIPTTSPEGPVTPHPINPWEVGYKDTVIAYPGEITTVRAKFDIVGLYVWHCHIVEHEDNEMMRPFVVSP
ncbi:MAG: multicopper oxidase domain-containing protein [Geothermobacteraceae bacterium]